MWRIEYEIILVDERRNSEYVVWEWIEWIKERKGLINIEWGKRERTKKEVNKYTNFVYFYLSNILKIILFITFNIYRERSVKSIRKI